MVTKIKRQKVTLADRSRVIDKLICALEDEVAKKGCGAFVSTHEIYGVLAEEFNELGDAMHDNNMDAFKKELMDLAVGVAFALAGLENK